MPSTLSFDEYKKLLVSLERKLQAQHNMIVGLERMGEAERQSPVAICQGESLRAELQQRIQFLEEEIEFLKGGGTRVDDASLCLIGHWVTQEALSHARVAFRIRQLRERLKMEQSLAKALRSFGVPQEEGANVAEQQKWKALDRNWQLYLADTKARLIADALKSYDQFVPPSLIDNGSYESYAISGTLNIKVMDVFLPEDKMETLVVQAWADGTASEPVKIKRKGIACAINTQGVTLDLKQAHGFELVLFEKSARPLAFLFFRLSWLDHYISSSFDRSFDEHVDLIPSGKIHLTLRLRKTVNYDSFPLISRQKVIKRKFVKRMGHDFRSSSTSALVLKCAHCQELIYAGSSVQCKKCRFTCHRSCTDYIYVRCIADANYLEWEDLTKALLQHGHAHSLEGLSAKTPCFCCHCGHLIPITSAATESYRCAECGVSLHVECETYLPALCGLKRTDAVRIARMYDKISFAEAAEIVPIADLSSSKGSHFREDQFEYLTVIGKGNFGKVMLARYVETGDLFAVKILKKASIIDNDEVDSLLAERHVFSCANEGACPFLVSCHGIFQNETRIFFVMEYVAGGDLMFHIQKHKFTVEQATFFAAQVLLALEYLHKKEIMYRDLKLDNILLGLDGNVKLADYGLCKAGMAAGLTTVTFCGTPEFMAPEILQEKPYTRAVDFWAFGVLLYELLFFRAPFHGRNEQEIFKAIMGSPITFPAGASNHAKDLISGLLSRTPDQRLGGGRAGAEAVKAHPFFAPLDFAKLAARKLRPPFKPSLVLYPDTRIILFKSSPVDTSNFDSEFTAEVPLLTPMPSLKSPHGKEDLFTMVTVPL